MTAPDKKIATANNNHTLASQDAMSQRDRHGDQTWEFVDPLNLLKQSCLCGLDALLQSLVTCTGRKRREHRTVFQSILESARQLNKTLTETSNIYDRGSVVETLQDVGRVLCSVSAVEFAYTQSIEFSLCYALVSLVQKMNNLSELVSSTPFPTEQDNATTAVDADPSCLCERLLCEITAFRDQNIGTDALQSQTDLWAMWLQIQSFMDVTYRLIQTRQSIVSYDALPAYTPNDENSPPRYTSPPPFTFGKVQNDFDQLLSAIDRLGHYIPRLNEQRTTNAAWTAPFSTRKAIERLSRGRLEDQRAILRPIKTKENTLRDVFVQIEQLTLKTVGNQKVCLHRRQRQRAVDADNDCLLERNDRGRLSNQDWLPPNEQHDQCVSPIGNFVSKARCRPHLSLRFRKSVLKERDFKALFKKVDQLEKRRMENQDATHTYSCPSYANAKAELSDLFDRMERSQLHNQRAAFRADQCAQWRSASLVAASS